MSQFESVVSRIPELARVSELDVRVLSGGLTNTSYLVSTDHAQLVVRIGCDNAPTLGIDRVTEEAATMLAHRGGIAPQVLLFTQPEGHLVTRYLAGAHGLSPDEIVIPTMVARVAALLSKVHSLGTVAGRFDPYADIRRWTQILESRRTEQPVRLGPLLDLVLASEHDRTPVMESELVLCHNDPYHLNFLDDGALWLIDWEYAGMGDAMYDLAGIAYRLDSDGRNHLLASYFGAVNRETREHLESLIPVYICWNVLWCLVESDGGMVGIDYLDLAEDFLDRVPYPS